MKFVTDRISYIVYILSIIVVMVTIMFDVDYFRFSL